MFTHKTYILYTIFKTNIFFLIFSDAISFYWKYEEKKGEEDEWSDQVCDLTRRLIKLYLHTHAPISYHFFSDFVFLFSFLKKI